MTMLPLIHIDTSISGSHDTSCALTSNLCFSNHADNSSGVHDTKSICEDDDVAVVVVSSALWPPVAAVGVVMLIPYDLNKIMVHAKIRRV